MTKDPVLKAVDEWLDSNWGQWSVGARRDLIRRIRKLMRNKK